MDARARASVSGRRAYDLLYLVTDRSLLTGPDRCRRTPSGRAETEWTEEGARQVLVVVHAAHGLYDCREERVIGVAIRPPSAGAIKRRLANDQCDHPGQLEAIRIARIDVPHLRKIFPVGQSRVLLQQIPYGWDRHLNRSKFRQMVRDRLIELESALLVELHDRGRRELFRNGPHRVDRLCSCRCARLAISQSIAFREDDLMTSHDRNRQAGEMEFTPASLNETINLWNQIRARGWPFRRCDRLR